jgi:hypothetical protein
MQIAPSRNRRFSRNSQAASDRVSSRGFPEAADTASPTAAGAGCTLCPGALRGNVCPQLVETRHGAPSPPRAIAKVSCIAFRLQGVPFCPPVWFGQFIKGHRAQIFARASTPGGTPLAECFSVPPGMHEILSFAGQIGPAFHGGKGAESPPERRGIAPRRHSAGSSI